MLLRPLLLTALFAPLAAAQTPDTSHRATGTRVSGLVHDSIARAPLAGAIVQIVAAEGQPHFSRTVVSDSLGRFTLDDVPVGHYLIGFFHPVLDSLGVDAPLREVHVDGPRPERADLGIPSAARLRAAICGPRSATDSSAVLVGVVRDAWDKAPAAEVTVTGEWLEFSFRPGGLGRRIVRRVATTGENGWFAMCNVPTAGTMTLIASRGADSTDLIEVHVPAEGFVRRELYLGSARTVVAVDTATRANTPAPPARRIRVGDGRLSGTVVGAAEGKPIVGAQVSIASGPVTRTDERGQWTLVQVPVGTRMLEVRAVGYYPEHRRVDVVAGVPPIRVALSTLKAVLDTVRVSAARRLYDRDRNGFQQRRRSGLGRYLSSEEIARRQPLATSDLFRMVPGVRVGQDESGFERRLLVRGSFGWCSPAIYVDGRNMMDGLSADDIDSWVRPEEVAGIEVYTESSVPAEFQQGLSGCGSVVIWTK